MRLDIIGDIHGQLGALERLGAVLGYEVESDWRHPEGRKLVFLGDLVDRGPDSLGVAQRVKTLVDRGDALCLMGNHELNLVEWSVRGGKKKPSNRATIDHIEANRAAWAPVLEFFQTLPLALELDDLRVVHAAWHRGAVAEVEPVLGRPDPAGVHAEWAPWVRLHSPYSQGGLREGLSESKLVDPVYGPQDEAAFALLLKGHEEAVEVPFADNEGHERWKARSEWWRDGRTEVETDKRVVVGHYWNLPPVPGRNDTFVPPFPSGHAKLRAWSRALAPHVPSEGRVPVPEAVQAVCVDFNGVVNGGGPGCLGAYRHPEAEVVWATDQGLEAV